MRITDDVVRAREEPIDGVMSKPVAKKEVQPRKRIYAYGFDRIGFSIPPATILIEDIQIEFMRFGDPRRLDGADGAIVPSGIFEAFERKDSYMGLFIEVSCDHDHLLTRRRELSNLLDGGKWICFLVGQVVDSVRQNHSTFDCSATDLAKVALNMCGVERQSASAGMVASAKYDEFREYVNRWGVAKTLLQPSYRLQDQRSIAVVGNSIVGLECISQLIFLPFHNSRSDSSELSDLVTTIVKGIESYLQKRMAELPNWIDQFQFNIEEMLRRKYEEALGSVEDARSERQKWRGYKGILVRSGDALRETVSVVLKDYFGLRVCEEDVGKEDLSILGEGGEILAVVEVKSSKGGVRREDVNQVDSHRARLNLPSTVPGILVMNDFMEISNLDERRSKPVDPDHIRRASVSNVLIIRTLDLVHFMKQMEQESPGKRAEALRSMWSKGGGLFRATEQGLPRVEQLG